MSVSYEGYALIGCEVTDKIPRTRMVTACEHVFSVTQKFCAECGKPRLREEPVHPEEDPSYEILKRSGMTLAWSTDWKRIFAGIAVKCWGDELATRKVVDFGNVKVNVREVLEPLGLWRDEAFGLWCVMYCSY